MDPPAHESGAADEPRPAGAAGAPSPQPRAMETKFCDAPELLDGLKLHSCGNFAHIERTAATNDLYYHCYHCDQDMEYRYVAADGSSMTLPFNIVTYTARERDKVPVQQIVNRMLPFDKTLQRSQFHCETCGGLEPAVLIPTRVEDLAFARVCEKCLSVS